MLRPVAFLSLLCILASATVRAQDSNIATINGEPISYKFYVRRMEFLPGVGKRVGPNWVEAFPGLITLDTLITETLLAQIAKQKGVLPTASAIANEKKVRLEENPSLIDDWLTSGRTEEELDQTIKSDLVYYNLVTFGITITDQEVKSFYQKNPSNFTIPKQVKLAVIAASDQAASEAVDKALSSGKSFAAAAKEFSLDVSKVNGGDLDMQEFASLGDPIKTAIDAIKIGQTTKWIVADSGIRLKFMLKDVIKEKVVPLTDRLTRSIRNKLATQRGSIKNDVRKELIDLRAKANIVIGDKAMSDAYLKFVADYLKQSKG